MKVKAISSVDIHVWVSFLSKKIKRDDEADLKNTLGRQALLTENYRGIGTKAPDTFNRKFQETLTANVKIPSLSLVLV